MAEESSSIHSDRNGRLESLQQAHGNAAGSKLPSSRHPGHQSPLPDHASIQSMLKNSTEVGDVGLFSLRPPRVPPSGSAASAGALTMPRAVQRTCPQTSSRVYREQSVNDESGCSEHCLKSNSYLYPSGDHYSPDTDNFESDRGLPLNGYRSFSLTKSSYMNHAAMSRQHSGYSTRSQEPSNLYSGRSRSPFIYPARLRRPGYRPSSPALSDLSKSMPWKAPDQQNHCTASPASIRKTNTNASTRPKSNDQSELALKYDPLPRTPDPSNSKMLKPALSLRSAASSSHLSYMRVIDDASWTSLHCSLSPPVFYDYTEAFEESTHIRRLGISVAQHTRARLCEDVRQLVPEASNSPKVSFIAELPFDAGRPTRRNDVNKMECLSSVPNLREDQSGELQSSHNEDSFERATMPSKQDPKEGSAKEDILFEVQTKKSSHEAGLQQEGAISHSPYSLKLENGLLINSREASDSQTGSMYSAGSFTTKEHSEETTVPSSAVDTFAENPRDLLRTPPSINSTRQAVIGPMNETGPSLLQKADSELPSHKILASTPERSIASLTARERLSKILSIDEDLSEAQRPTAAPAFSFRGGSCKNVSSGRKFGVTCEARHATPSVAGSENLPAEDSDSGDEHELSKGFRETFGKLRRIDSEEKMSVGVFLAPTSTEQTLTTERDAHLAKSSERQVSPSIRLSHRKTSIIHGLQQPSNEQKSLLSVSENRRASSGRNKDLLAAPQDHRGVKSATSPGTSFKAGHSFSFTPIIHCTSTGEPQGELQAPISADDMKPDPKNQMEGCLPLEARRNIARVSKSPPSNSWLWDIEASCPWDDKTPVLDVFAPSPEKESSFSHQEQFPRFKLRIHRASSSTGETGERIKRGQPLEDASSSLLESWTDRSKDLPLRRKLQPDLSTHPGQSNSSHDVVECRPMQTRFVESFQNPSRTSPIVTLLPPSPGHEVRSFFSDDSSQVQMKGSLRKRLSNFKTRQVKSGSGGYHQGYDRGLLSSAFGISRTSGRSSRQSLNTEDEASQRSRTGLLRWTMLNRVRSWFLSHEDRVREWRRRRQHKNDSPRKSEVQPYAGV